MMRFKLGPLSILLAMIVTTGFSAVPTGLDMKLMKTVTQGLGENQAISPFVMSTLMTQVWLGARGATRREMTPVLGLSRSAPRDFLRTYRSAIDYIAKGSSKVITGVFNRMYIRRGFSIKPTFKRLLTIYYRASARTFSSASQAAKEINTDVAAVTRDRIKKLVAPAALMRAELVLVSALYFKGVWKYTFDTAKKASFLTESGEKQVDMMHLKETKLPYAYMKTYEAVALPYTDEDYGMLVIIPSRRSMAAVKALRNSIDSINIANIIKHLKPMSISVSMPRFKIKTSYELSSAMERLGIRKIFGMSADFSGITDGTLFVSNIIHKVFIEVTEKGTEAAGAGAVIFTKSLPPHLVADRPFFAVVYNKKHNLSLFSAFVSSP
nr:adult cement protein 21 [Chelonibia testudinaria]